MRLSDFDFELPEAAIALRPASPRDSAKLLHVDAKGGLAAHHVSDLPQFLTPQDIVVVNNTKVIPARLSGRRVRAGQDDRGAGAHIDITLTKRLDACTWACFLRPAKRVAEGDRLICGDIHAHVEQRVGAEAVLQFDVAPHDMETTLLAIGKMPLPPYIESKRASDARDIDDYQTIFARQQGAVAAPTAGLHFTDSLRQKIKAMGCKICALTLHVGAGTFLPVREEDIHAHKLHAEWGEISAQMAAELTACRKNGGRIVAVGTTSARLLESACNAWGIFSPFCGETDIFITPGYRFKAVDMLLTNFHLPRSTLFMLVAAFSGLAHMQAAYRYALAHDYRFYSYGDACLLERAQ